MKILITSLYFFPDHSGIALYSSDFAFYAAQCGHKVEVITGYSFYPKWEKKREDKNRIISSEKQFGIKILRGFIYVPQKPTTIKRIFQELSFLLSATFNMIRAKKPDVLVAFTTPISIGFLASVYKRIIGCRLVINVQDFQLEAADSLGMSKHNFFYSILAGLEKSSFKKADLICTISKSMYDLLLFKKGLALSKIYLWPNWIETENYKLDEKRKGIFKAHHKIPSKKKIIAYAGNIGLKQGLEILVDLAIRYNNEDIVFMIIGEGAGRIALQEYASEKEVDNIVFLPLLNTEQYLDFLNDLDIFFLSQKKTKFDVYFPSKLLGLMATKKILLLSADKNSELYITIKENQLGLVAEYGAINELKELLDKVLNDENMMMKICNNAIEYVAQFDKKNVLDHFLNKLKQIEK